jgi:hypothetical protein
MMSLSSSQAGIVGARRKKLNSTQFSSYRYVKVEYNSPVSFVDAPPKAKNSFTARHIYSYSKINNTFTLLGVQKAQSLIRKKEWVNQLVFTGSDPAILDGTYIRSDVNSTVYWKNGIINQEPYIAFEEFNDWWLINGGGMSQAVLTSYENQWTIISLYVAALDNPAIYYTTSTTIDNTTLKNINNNRLYSTKDADLSREQLIPDVNFNINTSNIFDTKNLAHNEKVFVDVRWVKFTDGRRRSFDGFGPISMNDKKGNIYRAGILIKDNTIDSMLYHTDLVSDESLRKHMQHGKNFDSILGIA